MAQSVEALRYKPENRGFDNRWYHWNFALTVAQGSTQPVTEMTTWNVYEADNLTTVIS
jgi:hypothetical protein